MIDNAFIESQKYYKSIVKNDWKKEYYQKANRLAFLYFLEKNNISAILLEVLFYGDFYKLGVRNSPQKSDEWLPAIKKEEIYLGISTSEKYQNKVKYLYLPVAE